VAQAYGHAGMCSAQGPFPDVKAALEILQRELMLPKLSARLAEGVEYRREVRMTCPQGLRREGQSPLVERYRRGGRRFLRFRYQAVRLGQVLAAGRRLRVRRRLCPWNDADGGDEDGDR